MRKLTLEAGEFRVRRRYCFSPYRAENGYTYQFETIEVVEKTIRGKYEYVIWTIVGLSDAFKEKELMRGRYIFRR
jgi:hypothetical protein